MGKRWPKDELAKRRKARELKLVSDVTFEVAMELAYPRIMDVLGRAYFASEVIWRRNPQGRWMPEIADG